MTIGIIGFGRFGILTASILSKKFRVKVYDRKNNNEMTRIAKMIKVKFSDLSDVAHSDIVILAVPISKTEQLIKKISPFIKKGALVMDTCSVKTYPCEWLEKHIPKNAEIIGTHPMFGPVTTKFDLEKKTWNLKGLQIVLCPIRIKRKRLSLIIRSFTKVGLNSIIATPEEHDKQNAMTLSMVHFLGRSLLKVGISEQKIYTPGFTDLLSILPHTTSDNWQLFYDMHNYNPYAEELREKFIKSCEYIDEKIERAAENDDLDFYRKMIDSIDYKFIDLLTKRFEYVKKIGEIKKKKKMPVIDRKREALILMQKARQSKLNKNFLKNLYDLIFKASYKIQK